MTCCLAGQVKDLEHFFCQKEAYIVAFQPDRHFTGQGRRMLIQGSGYVYWINERNVVDILSSFNAEL